jgi:hypothetical protein
MADYTNSRKGAGSSYPENAIETARQQVEPLITVDLLKSRHLFGVPLVSAQKDPLTGKSQVMTDDMLADIIEGAVAQAEIELKIDIFPVKRQEKQPFDINLYNAFGYFQLQHRPATSVDKLSVTPSNGLDVYVVPNEWVEGAYLHRGQINIVPLTVAFVQGTYIPQQSSGGAAFLQILGNRAWIPAWWQVEYTSGFPDGMVPRIINDYIGTQAAHEILSMLALTYARANSHSLGIDGLSQSVSTPGPQIFKVRMDELEEKRKRLEKKIKAIFGFKIFSGTL